MKHLNLTMAVLVLCMSISFGAIEFDYIISDTWLHEVSLINEETLLVTGAGAGIINALDFSYIKIQNTAPFSPEFGGIEAIRLRQDSRLDYYGGQTLSLFVYDTATVVVQGGSIDVLTSYQTGTPNIEIVCKNYEYDSNTNLLTGTWVDDSTFSIQLDDQSGYTSVIDNIEFNVIPEPATLMMLGSGALFLLRRKK